MYQGWCTTERKLLGTGLTSRANPAFRFIRCALRTNKKEKVETRKLHDQNSSQKGENWAKGIG